MKWLHLSDIHYNPQKDGRSSDQLRKKLPLYLEKQNIRVDEIFITGDFRHAVDQRNNLPDVAKEAVEYIWEIAKSVGVDSADKIHIVAGNHDLTRSDSSRLERIVKNYDCSSGNFLDEDLLHLQSRFDFFHCICQELYGNEIVYNDFRSSVHSYHLAGNYVILCMNTAVTCGRNNERGELIIGNFYLYKSLEKIKKEYPNKEIIVLAHHSLNFLSKSEQEQVELLFSESAIAIYLCGDAHEIWGRKINNWCEITTGCLVQAKGIETVFCIGDITDDKTEITAYQWDEKFANWSVYDGFNNHINKLLDNPKRETNSPTVLPPDEHNLPKLARNYRINDQIKTDSFSILRKNRLLYLSGMSGIGKTSLSIKLSEVLKNEFQFNNIYFIDASKIISAQGLHSVDLDMAGSKINLLGMIKMEQSLYIIDDLQENIDDIVEQLWSELNESRKSFVIITSQIDSRFALSYDLQLSVPFLTDEKEISDILNLYLPKQKQCPDNLIGTIRQKTNGHPLLLNSLRTLVHYDNANWQDILEEELKDFIYHEVEDGKTLMAKILNRHYATLERELVAIRWLDCKYVSASLLSKFITKEGIRKLFSRSFIQESPNSGIIKVHDIIFDSITESRHTEDIMINYNEKLNKCFYEYFIKERNDKSAAYYKSLHLHENQLFNLAKKKDEPGIEWYFYTQAFPNDDYGVFQSFSYTGENCRSWLTSDQAEYTIGTLLELMERKSRNERSTSSYNEMMENQIQTLNFLLSQISTEDNLRFDILHHLGKLYRNIDSIDKAIECFKKVLNNKTDSYESKLQLIRIQKNQNKLPVKFITAEYAELLDTYIKGSQISMSIVLAAYGDLYSVDKEGVAKRKYFLDEFTHFKKAILSMAVEAFDQPYNVLALTLKFYTYNHPDKLFLLVDNLPIPSTEMINKSNYFDIAQMYKEIGKATMWTEGTSQAKSSSNYFKLAEEFYRLLDSTRLKSEYNCVQRAENLILLGRYSDAVTFLMEHEFNESPFWNYRIGQAFAVSDTEKALQYLQAAIDLCKQEIYLASFNHAMANILAEMKDSHAIYYYQEALKLCGDQNDKYKKQIETDMETRLTRS
jgi:predicted phosphodiesterase